MTPAERERAILEHMERRMREMGVVTTAHYDACNGMIATALYVAMADGREAGVAEAEARHEKALSFLKDRVWLYDHSTGLTECWECGASFGKMEPCTHKPGCELAEAVGDKS